LYYFTKVRMSGTGMTNYKWLWVVSFTCKNNIKSDLRRMRWTGIYTSSVGIVY